VMIASGGEQCVMLEQRNDAGRQREKNIGDRRRPRGEIGARNVARAQAHQEKVSEAQAGPEQDRGRKGVDGLEDQVGVQDRQAASAAASWARRPTSSITRRALWSGESSAQWSLLPNRR